MATRVETHVRSQTWRLTLSAPLRCYCSLWPSPSLPAGGGRVPGSTGFLTGPQVDGAHASNLQSLTISTRRSVSTYPNCGRSHLLWAEGSPVPLATSQVGVMRPWILLDLRPQTQRKLLTGFDLLRWGFAPANLPHRLSYRSEQRGSPAPSRGSLLHPLRSRGLPVYSACP